MYKVEADGEVVAIVINKSFSYDGIKFFTPNDYSQQLGYMKRKAGYEIPLHYHNHIPRAVSLTQEVLFIKSGKVVVELYSSNRLKLKDVILEEGDVILLAAGGHGFRFLEESEIIEVKQGPYCDNDKTRF